MSLPQSTDLLALGFGDDGEPFDLQAPGSGAGTASLGWGADGEPLNYAPVATSGLTLSLSGNKATGKVGSAAALVPISVRGTSTGPNTASTSSTISLPSGIQVGDVSILSAVNSQSNTKTPTGAMVPPSGWTTIVSTPSYLVCYRVYQSGDPTSVTFTYPVSGWAESAITTYSGCDTAAPIDAANSAVLSIPSAGFQTNAVHAPSVSPAASNGRLVCVYMLENSGGGSTPTLPSGTTQRVLTTSGPCVLMCDMALGTAAPTNGLDATWSTSGTGVFGAQIALKAAGATAGTRTPAASMGGATMSSVTSSAGAVESFSANLTPQAPQVGDLVLVGITSTTTSAGTPPYGAFGVTPPSGYTSVLTNGAFALYSHTWAAGDSLTPTFAASDGTTKLLYVCAAVLVRGSAGATVSVDTTGVGTSATSTVSIPSLTPAGSAEALLGFFNSANASSAGTWTSLPAGMTSSLSETGGPFALFSYRDNVSAATSTESAASGTANLDATGVLVKAVVAGSLTLGVTGNKATGKVGTATASSATTTTLAITGNKATSRVGSLVDTLALALSGDKATGRVGTAAALATHALSGNALSSKVGTVGATTATVLVLGLTGNAGTTRLGALAAAIARTIGGNKATTTVGTLASPAVTLGLAGNAATGRVGSIRIPALGSITGTAGRGRISAPSTTRTLALSGAKATARVGQASSQLTVLPTGVTGASRVGSVQAAETGKFAALTGDRATGHAGAATPSVQIALTGNKLTAKVGVVAPARGLSLTASPAAGRSGAVVPGLSVAARGQTISCVVGSVVTSSAQHVTLTGNLARGAAGLVGPVNQLGTTGVTASGAAGALSPVMAPRLAGVSAKGRVHLVGAGSIILYGVDATGDVGSVGATLILPIQGVRIAGKIGRPYAGKGGGPVVIARTTDEQAFATTLDQHVVGFTSIDSAFSLLQQVTALAVPQL